MWETVEAWWTIIAVAATPTAIIAAIIYAAHEDGTRSVLRQTAALAGIITTSATLGLLLHTLTTG